MKKAQETKVILSTDSNVWRGVQARALDTVVQVFAQISMFNWFEPYKAPDENSQYGSAFFINDEGYLVTNFHVVDQASAIRIQIPSLGREQFDVTLVGAHPDMDIALLRLESSDLARVRAALGGVSYLELGDSDAVYRTQVILALGYPLGQLALKSTQGIVSGREKINMLSYIQMTAPINPGSSGGPSLDESGTVVGINFAGVAMAQNVGYIIPINEIKAAITNLFSTRLLKRPVLGAVFSISSQDIVKYLGNPGEGGFYVAQVFADSLFEKAGIDEGDMIYEINGYEVDRFGEISVAWSEDKISIFDLLNRLVVGERVTLVVFRKGKRIDVSFDLDLGRPLPIRFRFPMFEEIDYEIIGGMVVMDLTLNHAAVLSEHIPAFNKYFDIEYQRWPRVIITNILHDSQAQRTRALSVGDVLAEVNDQKVYDLEDFRKAMLLSKENGYITIKTQERLFTVMSVARVVADEPELCARYSYKPSDLIKKLS